MTGDHDQAGHGLAVPGKQVTTTGSVMLLARPMRRIGPTHYERTELPHEDVGGTKCQRRGPAAG